MTLYVVSVAGPQPTWIRWNSNAGIPQFTFQQPAGVSLDEAQRLKDRADATCGGTLSLLPVDA